MGVITKTKFRNIKKCYVVKLGAYPTPSWLEGKDDILGVFSSKKKARRFADEMVKKSSWIEIENAYGIYIDPNTEYGDERYVHMHIVEYEMDIEPNEQCYNEIEFKYKSIKIERKIES